MKYQIDYENHVIDVEVTYKKIKAIYMKVEDGMIKVSAPIGTSWTYIEKVIDKHRSRLFKEVLSYQEYYDYRDNGYVLIFNQLYTIKLMHTQKRHCAIHHDCLYVYHKDIQKTVEMFLKDLLYDYIQKRIDDYLLGDFYIPMPYIEIKKYKRRWGCCYVKEEKVSFNFSLVHLDKELIDYVIVHELTHFLVHDHSQMFYSEVQKRLKDYKVRQKRLKEVHV